MKPTPKLTDAADDILAAALGVLAVAREARNALEARNAAADAVVARYAVRLARRRQGTVRPWGTPSPSGRKPRCSSLCWPV